MVTKLRTKPAAPRPAEPGPQSIDEAWALRDSDPSGAFEYINTTAIELEPPRSVHSDVLRSFLLYRRGELQDALALIIDAIGQLKDTPLSPWHGRASNTAALIYSGLGLPEPAVELLLTAQQQSQAAGDHPTAFSCFHNMGVELGEMGDIDGALANYRKAEEFADAGLDGHAFLALNRCHLYLENEDVEAALATVEAGKRHWAESHNQARVFGLLVEARVALAADNPTAAEKALRTLRDEFDPTRAGVELPILEAHLHLHRGDLDEADATLLTHGLHDPNASIEDVYLAARLVQLHAELAETRGDYRRALAITRTARNQENRARRQAMSRVTTLIMNENTRQLEAQNKQLNETLEELRLLHAQVNELALRDHLTGLHNRRYLAEHVDDVVEQHLRYGRDLSLLVFDIDNFKAINDTHLHSTGDVVLQMVANVLRSQKRAADVLCRVGGDEFVALLPETNLAGAQVVAKRLHAAVKQQDWSKIADGLDVGVSVGITTATAGDSLDDLLLSADKAMYGAKSAGKDQVNAR